MLPIKKIIVAFLIMFIILPQWAHAEEPLYQGYIYNSKGESLPSPHGYVYEKSITGKQMGIGDFKTPQDIFVSHDNTLYILDSGNKRILILNENLKLTGIIENLLYENQEEQISQNASGLFVDQDGQIYIADTGNQRILITDSKGYINNIIVKPETEMIDPSIPFEPRSIVADMGGIMYVLSNNLNMGALVIDSDNNFLGFYGMNRVETTLDVLAEMFWRRLSTKAQIARSKVFIPVEYSGFDIDDRDFIYTVTTTSKTGEGQIKKLNQIGRNIFPDIAYGDLETQKGANTAFIDINVDPEGFVNALDRQNGRVFQYDQQGQLLTIFGGIGLQKGYFRAPIAIESMNGKILVLDTLKNSITIFEPTIFIKTTHKAVMLYNNGMYEEAMEPWKQVLKMNMNYELAYVGIGKALMLTDRYQESMDYFKKGNDKETYSKVKKAYRSYFVRKNFPIIALGIVLVVLFIRFYPIITLKLSSKIKERGNKLI